MVMGERQTVLIVQCKAEDPIVENLLKRLCTELPDHDHLALTHGPSVFESIQKIGPQLILFDLSEGIAHSPETVKTLKQLFRGAPIFGLIDDSSYELEREALLLGVRAVFTKKDDNESLIRNIQAVLQRRD